MPGEKGLICSWSVISETNRSHLYRYCGPFEVRSHQRDAKEDRPSMPSCLLSSPIRSSPSYSSPETPRRCHLSCCEPPVNSISPVALPMAGQGLLC